jgi:hypothetical protein
MLLLLLLVAAVVVAVVVGMLAMLMGRTSTFSGPDLAACCPMKALLILLLTCHLSCFICHWHW